MSVPMPPVALDTADVAAWVARLWWPSLRIGGFVLAAPISGENAIPRRVKVVFTLALAGLLAPLVPVPPHLDIFSGVGALTAAQEVVIGIAIGLVVQLAFDALMLAGQTISMTMGLGFATLVDPQRGANVTVLGQMFTIIGLLTYLAIDGHLMLLGALANSFQTLPIGGANFDQHLLSSVAGWGAGIFASGLLIALPVVIALVIVNIALGVVSRSAPQLNLFGIGFTITLLCGFVVLLAGLDGVMDGMFALIDGALRAAVDLVASPRAGAH